MATLLIALGSLVLYLIAYHTYGKWLGRKLFRLDAAAEVPSVTLEDDKDYVPTNRFVLFGHHFTSIAGTGPIVGPAVAVIWGWVPALLWVLFGSIFIGAIHDLGALVVSVRNQGQSVGDIAGKVITKPTRLIFLCVLFLAITMILAIFGLVISAVFRLYPASIFPCLMQIPLAMGIGFWLHRSKHGILLPSVIVLVLMYLSVIYGNWGPLNAFNTSLAAMPTLTWVLFLLLYAYVASVIPVWTLLQPRDFINSLQLVSALALLLLGLGVAGFVGGAAPSADAARPALEIVAPALNVAPEGAPPIFPFLFIVIACGAVSGFHCLVSSGTSSKQLGNEKDAVFVGYGSMLTEGFLAVLVILACVAGLGLGSTTPDGDVLTGAAAFDARYSSWNAMDGSLGAKVGAFVDGAANFLKTLGFSEGFSVALMGVFVASFAGTTLDSACRLQRYVVQEAAATLMGDTDGNPARTGLSGGPLAWLRTRHGAAIFAIVIAFLIALLPGKTGGSLGTGGLLLWPLFGATNQLLAGLTFLVVAFWLKRRGMPTWLCTLPGVLMLVLPAGAMVLQIRDFAGEGSWQGWLLVAVGVLTLLLEAWMISEAFKAWPKVKKVLDENGVS